MLKTNSKKVNEKIKNLIIDSYQDAEEYYSYEGREVATDYEGICADILNAFEIEKVKYDNRYKANLISKQALFYDWMQGLPSAFPIADDIFLHSDAVDFMGDLLEETESEKARFTTTQAEELACNLLYRELTKHAKKCA